MNEYISKEYMRNVVLKHWSDSVGAECYAYARVLDDIGDAPVADVVKIERGYWKEHYSILPDDTGKRKLLYVCSRCGYIDDEKRTSRGFYCWHCGAKMEDE